MDRSFDHLSPEERAVVGDPGDYDWDDQVQPGPPQPRGGRTQFSMRLDQVLYDRIAAIASARGVSFSDIVREALLQTANGVGPARPAQMLSFGGAGRIMTTEHLSIARTVGPDVPELSTDQDERVGTSMTGVAN